MDIFKILDLLGGLCLFLFGMSLMGSALERRAGNRLKSLLGKITSNKFTGLLTGLCVTAIIQSSSATTVMVVGFVNSGLMTLSQSINVIMGANIGTTVTAWILSLAGIESSNVFIKLLKPSSFTPILALIGIVYFMISKDQKKKDTGMILLGFTTLMFGMETMSSSVSILKNNPQFQQLFLTFTNPFLGIMAGAVLTAVIQSSSASVGILQALSSTGAVTYGAAIPIILGQNIGTCATALLSSIGTGKNARRAAMVHLCFNILGALIFLLLFIVIKSIANPLILNSPSTPVGIAVSHSIFNLFCTVILFPFTSFIEKLVCLIIPESVTTGKTSVLDERLLSSPTLALNQVKSVLVDMAEKSIKALETSMKVILNYNDKDAEYIREIEEDTDHTEDLVNTYLLKITSRHCSEEESVKATAYLKIVGDYERIADHAVGILESAEEKKEKSIIFTEEAEKEYLQISAALDEILHLSFKSFAQSDIISAKKTEPLEQLIDRLKEELRTRHYLRLQRGECSAAAGFIWSDLLTNFERVSDHCSNISGCVLDTAEHTMDIHKNLRQLRTTDEDFKDEFKKFSNKYRI